MFCLFDIPFNHFLRIRLCRPHVVSDFPEPTAPKIRLSNLGIPFQQVLARVRLELPSDISRTVLRGYLDELVNVVICNLQSGYECYRIGTFDLEVERLVAQCNFDICDEWILVKDFCRNYIRCQVLEKFP